MQSVTTTTTRKPLQFLSLTSNGSNMRSLSLDALNVSVYEDVAENPENARENEDNWNVPGSRTTLYVPADVSHPVQSQLLPATGASATAETDSNLEITTIKTNDNRIIGKERDCWEAAAACERHGYPQPQPNIYISRHAEWGGFSGKTEACNCSLCRTSTAGPSDASPQPNTATFNHHRCANAHCHPHHSTLPLTSLTLTRNEKLKQQSYHDLNKLTETKREREGNFRLGNLCSTRTSEGEMPRPTLKKPEAPKMADRTRRTPSTSYTRPKSRSDASSRMESRLRGDGGASSDEDLARQNTDLRQRLHDEASLYRKRLDTYRQAQQSQATLVSRLQAKVLQYKQRCADLESHIVVDTSPGPRSAAPASALEQAQQHLRDIREERITDLEVALARLDDERRKNKLLREQLDESQQTNEDLTSDLQKLTNQFEELREEMLIKEDEWKDEEQAFNDYYSTEHNRLLTLWRDVVSIKRLFMEVQSTTEKDLSKLKNDIDTSSRDIGFQCGKMDRTRAESMLSLIEPKSSFNLENVELKSQLELLKSQFESQKTDLRGKEDKVQELHKEIQLLEERCSEAEQSVSQVLRMQDEVDVLQNALRDIAHALIQDAEAKDLDPSHVHLTGATPVPQKSPKRSARSLSSSAFAESTISAVQAALHKHQSVIHELQVKLQSNREQFHLVRKQLETSEGQNSELETRLREILQQLDLCKNQCAQSCQERESLQKHLETLKNEKNLVEKQKHDVLLQVEGLNSDIDKVHKQNFKFQKEVEVLLDEKLYLQNEVDRLNQDASLREMNLRSEEDRCSRIREELLTTREELNKLYLSHDMLQQQKSEGEVLIQHLEKSKSDLEIQLEHVTNDRSDVHQSLVKREAMAGNLEHDKRRLSEEIKKLEDEKQSLLGQLADANSDIQSLRKELLQAEQAKLDLDSERISLGERTKFLEIEKSKVEMELAHVTRDRSDLSNQLIALSRKKEAVNEELTRTKQKLEQQTETNARINRNLEELVTESEEKQCSLDAMDKEVQRLQEQLASQRSEKETLEAVLFDTQTNLEASDVKRSQLEGDLQELLVKEESLKGQVQRLGKDLERSEKRCIEIKHSLTSQSNTQEVEFQHVLANLKNQHDDQVKKLTEERDLVRTSLEKKLSSTVQQLTNEKESEIGQLLERIDTMQVHIENLIQQHEELMLRAENDKQQALLIAHHDQQALQEKLEQLKRGLEEERDALDRCKRESNSNFEQNRILVNQLKEELTKSKAKLEDTRKQCEEERYKLDSQIASLNQEKDTCNNEVANLKVQIHVYEDKIDTLTNQLHDTLRKLKEVENSSDSLRKDLTDIRRQLTDCNFEKEKYHSSNKELRDLVKKIESEKRDQCRQLEETYQKLSTMEDLKGSLESEKTRLLNTLREAEKDQLQLDHKMQSLVEEVQRKEGLLGQGQAEEKELQGRLLNEVEERERAHQEVHTGRKQIAELERNLEQTRKELGGARAHQGHLEEQFHAREQDLLVHLEDCRSREKRLEDQKHNLEVCITDASQQIQELKNKLSAGESRLRALDAQLGQTETQKRETEVKLTSVVSTLKRFAGIQLDGTIVPQSNRLMSPSRRWSPARGGGASKEYKEYKEYEDPPMDIDPEAVRKGVRNLMQQVAHVERERDDLKSQITTFKKQLKESTETQSKGDGKLAKAIHNFRLLQEEKSSLEGKLSQKIVALNAQADALSKKSEEAQQYREKLNTLELTLGTLSEDKKLVEDKLDKLKFQLHKCDSDKRQLQEELGRTETRGAKMELQRMATEGDLHRLQMMLQERDATIQKQQEKADHQGRTLASLEERCASLKSTIDQLNQSLEKASNGESEMKVEIQSLQRSLLEVTTQQHTGQERLKHLQKSLATAENEKKILAERFDTAQQTLSEQRRSNQMHQDQIARLNNELSNCEIQRSGLESQLRLSQWPADSSVGSHHEEELMRQLQSTQRERNDLRGKVESLNQKLRQIESENRHLERAISKTPRSKSYERQEKYELERDNLDRQSCFKHEEEIRDLRLKVSKLEAELADKENELARSKLSTMGETKYSEVERYRAAQLQAERLLEAREQSHRQQVQRLEVQVQSLREQLNQEIKRRQQYVMRSSRAGREMQQLRQALGDSLRTVSQDPSLDALLLEQEARKLDHTASSTASLPPGLTYDRNTPQPPY